MKNTKKKGFTIVELVIVIAVIGILSAVLIPTFANLVSKANESAKQQGLANAYTQYASEYEVADGTLYTKDQVYFSATELADEDTETAGTQVTVDTEVVYNFTADAYDEVAANTDLEVVALGQFNGYYAYAVVA